MALLAVTTKENRSPFCLLTALPPTACCCLQGVQTCPPANVTAVSTALAQAAADNTTVAPVAGALGQACTQGQNTTAYAEAIAAAYTVGGECGNATSAALAQAAAKGGCAGVTSALAGGRASGDQYSKLLQQQRAHTGHCRQLPRLLLALL